LYGIEVTIAPRFWISNHIPLPPTYMSLQDLVRHLTNPEHDNTGPGTSEEFYEGAKLTLSYITNWLSQLLDNLEPSDARRELCLITLIGKEVLLETGEAVYICGMHEEGFLVQSRETKPKVVRIDEIAGEFDSSFS
jgi:hypothetical protein